MSILSFIPGAAYVKWIAIGAVVVGVFLAGWNVNGWRWQSKYTTRENALLAQANAAQQKYQAEVVAIQEEARQVTEEHEGKLASLNTAIDKLKRKSANAHFVAPPAVNDAKVANCEHPFTVEFPRDLNRLSSAADGAAVPAEPPAAPHSDGATEAPTPTSAVDGGTLVEWYAEVARLYGTCREQLDAIRKWDAK